jgi:hypothetical protein
MAKALRFLRLASPDRHLVLWSACLLAAVRLGLWFLPFGSVQRLLARHTRVRRRASVERIAWAVTVAGRYVPRSTCLVRALAAEAMLRACGHPACLHIGVARRPGGGLEAHAWVESDEQVVLGGLANMRRYTRLPPVRGEAP